MNPYEKTIQQKKKHRAEMEMAWVEGKQLQWRGEDLPNWEDYTDDENGPASWGLDYQWRIKPEPKLRPWKAEEVPVGALFRGDSRPGIKNAMLILESTRQGFYICRLGKLNFISLDELKGWFHSLDHGKTWHPCGVMETEEA